MEFYMVLAPAWAQVLPRPPPAAKYEWRNDRSKGDRHTVEVGGSWGRK